MQTDENIKNWIGCWEASKKDSNDLKNLGNPELWEKRAEMFANRLEPGKRQGRTKMVFELLDEVGFKPDGARVLDIGCGPGALSIPLARAGADVTAIDISSKALDYLKDNAEKEGLSLDTVKCHWWTADIDELGFRDQFDLVISSMTPAIKDYETFEKMNACSRKYCYLSHFIRKADNGADPGVYREILKTEPPRRSEGTIPGFFNIFMYIYLSGCSPLIRINHRQAETEKGWRFAAERAIEFIEMDHDCTEAVKAEIMNYYEKNAKAGEDPFGSDVYIGLMAWSKDR